MNQEWLIKNVLKNLDSIPDAPSDEREYLSFEEAQRIVDETIDYLGSHSDESGLDTEYTYISGHRKRLAHSLSMIPKAKTKGESCLDIGSYGYMLLWAKKYLGYDHVVGIEWHPDCDDKIIRRTLKLEGESIEVHSHNFDISEPKWAITESYDTVLFFEVLEHINHDPMGVMKRVHQRLKSNATLVMSVPNAISYKAFKEFLVGMPPWTYWFYEPDLSHEPRHCFEYTPIIFKALIKAAGLRENAFRTIYAYTEKSLEAETIQIARSFGIDDESFGETMIINATKVSEKINLRYPDVLYSPEGYYKTVYPHLHERLNKAIRHFQSSIRPPDQEIEPAPLPASIVEIKDESLNTPSPPSLNIEMENQNNLLRDQLAELLFTCDTQLRKQEEAQSRVEELIADKSQSILELKQTQDWANDLQREKFDLESRVNQLLFTCDCFLRKENDAEAQAIDASTEQETRLEQAQGELDHALQAQLAAETTEKQTRLWSESLAKENADLRAQVNELLFACDCYLQQVNDPARCVQVIRERRFRKALNTSKSVARKTPLLRTALRPVYRSTKKFIKKRM